MTRAFIWDLDGTLLDSYDAILAGIEETYMHYGLDFDRPAIHAYILQHSVQKLLEKVAIEKGLDAEEMNRFRGQSLQEKNAHQILADLEILDYFTEIVTTANGFARKPDPEGVNYLVEKYQLDKTSTYYIGDRTLDVDVAFNSGIQSINFCDDRPNINHKINHLLEIKQIIC